jgi:hypothetical protein
VIAPEKTASFQGKAARALRRYPPRRGVCAAIVAS